MNRLLIALALLVAGCDETKEAPKDLVPIDKDKPPKDPHGDKQKPAGEPDRIQVQHILVGFEGSLGPQSTKEIKRTKDEAKALAYELLGRAQKGEDFDELVKFFTDDSAPGKYDMANFGVEPQGEQEAPREGMVPAFGDVGFKLGVGQIGIADFDLEKSKYGWHVIKRLR